MKLLISLTVLMWQWNAITCDPGLVDLDDLPEFRKVRDKSAISTKFPSYNSITDDAKSTTPSTSASFYPIKLTHEDVVTGANSVYGSHQQMSNGGIIFAISQGQGQSTSGPLMSSGQPQAVLMQYLSPEGTPQQASVQYIQLLRPVMMVPGQPYNSAKPLQVTNPQFQTTTSSPPLRPSYLNPYGPYMQQPPVGAYSSPYTSYLKSNPIPLESQKPTYEMGLNMNEYVPSASSHHLSAVLSPRINIAGPISPYAFRPTKFQTIAQRA